jgi:drug/metabolite transporter (DMT)-like permease
MPKKKLPEGHMPAYIAIITTTLIWGAAGPVIKYTLRYIPPLTFLFLRFLIVCTILLPYLYLELKRVKINRKDYFNFFLLGLFSQAAIALIFLGLNYTTALDAAIIGVMGPLLSITAGHYFYKDKIDKNLKIGLLLSIIGTSLIVIEPALSGNSIGIIEKRLLGNFLIILYHLVWVVYVIWSKMSMGERSNLLKKTLSFVHLKPMTKKYSPTLITAVTFYIGLITLIPLAMLENFNTYSYSDILSIDPRGMVGLLYMALLSSIVAYMCYQHALEKLKVSEVAFFGYLGPIFTVPVAYILLGEIPNRIMLIGATFIVVGVYIAEKRRG